MHVSTVRRWIGEGKLSAYRVGSKGIRVRYADLERLVDLVTLDDLGTSIPLLTEEEQRDALNAIDEARRIQAEALERQGDESLAPSWELINEARDRTLSGQLPFVQAIEDYAVAP